MFLSKGETYWNNFETRAKFLCMALAGVNMAIYHFGMHKRGIEWDTRLPPPLSVRVAGALSIALWTGVVFFGALRSASRHELGVTRPILASVEAPEQSSD